MVTLYRNYTVVVQTSTTPYAPNSDLELLLYEGQLELKTNPAKAGANKTDVFSYGTATVATPVYDSGGVAATALAADTTDRPGEYDFVGIDLNRSGSASAAGETLYSVVARSTTDSAVNSFENARIIIENTDLSDSNVKQLVKTAIGGTASIVDNILFAGGTVTFEQYTTSVTNSSTVQHLKVTNLPDSLTALAESSSDNPGDANYFTPPANKLFARFNIFYSSADNSMYAEWHSVPAYQMADNSWVIRLQGDQYNLYRSHAFGSGGANIDLGAVYTQLKITVNLHDANIHIRRFNTDPSVTVPSFTVGENVVVHTRIDTGQRILGIGAWSYTGITPYYNLDMRGGRGARIAISGVPDINKMLITPTSSAFGYNTSASTNVVRFDASNAYLYGGTNRKVWAAQNSVTLGHNVTSLTQPPCVYISSSDVYLYGTATNYIRVQNSAEQITAYSNGVSKLDMTSSSSAFGYDTAGPTSVISFTSTNANIYAGSLRKLLATATALSLGHNTSAFPYLSATASGIGFYDAANSYIIMNSSEQLLSAIGGTRKLDVNATGTSFGYNTVGPTSTIAFSATLASIYAGAIRKFVGSAATLVIGNNTGSFPYMAADSTNIGFYGTSTLYVRVSTSVARMQHSANTYFQLSSNQMLMGFDSTVDGAVEIARALGGYSRFGYKTNNTATGRYIHADATAIYIHVQDVNVFSATTSEVKLGQNSGGYPVISAASSEISLNMKATGEYFKVTSAPSVEASVDGGTTKCIEITGSTTTFRFSSTVYMQLSAGISQIYHADPTNPTTQYSWLYMGDTSLTIRIQDDAATFERRNLTTAGATKSFHTVNATQTTFYHDVSADTANMGIVFSVANNAPALGDYDSSSMGQASGGDSYWKIPVVRAYTPKAALGTSKIGAMLLMNYGSTSYLYIDTSAGWYRVQLAAAP